MSKTPKHNGEFYFEPNPSQWKTTVLQNRENFSNKTLWGQIPSEVRASLKMPTDCPVILSGHQPIFFYPGIWAKCLAASELAQSVAGVAYHKITDTALAPEFVHSIPEADGKGKVRRREVDFFSTNQMKNQEKAIPYTFLPPPAPAALGKILLDFSFFGSASVQSSTKWFGEKLIQGLKNKTSWNQYHTYTLQLLDQISGTQRSIVEGSSLWASEPFINFFGYWLIHMAELNESYNSSLNEYRKTKNITHDIEPMPNLKFENWYSELPFWGTNKGHHRDTLWAKTDGKVITLKVKGLDVQYDFHLDNLSHELAVSSLKIWPKAIPQSLFLRMYLCDFFIHGIGGGVYEEVGNLFFQKTTQIAPPVYGIVSATYLVDPKESETLSSMADYEKALELWGRVLQQNPEYLFTRQADWKRDLPSSLHGAIESYLKNPSFKKMAQEKIALLAVLKDPVKKQDAGKKIKELNGQLFEGCGEVLKAMEKFRLETESIKTTREALAYREYPFFCFEESVFRDMKEKIKRAFVEGWK
jgi:hypothetical protein